LVASGRNKDLHAVLQLFKNVPYRTVSHILSCVGRYSDNLLNEVDGCDVGGCWRLPVLSPINIVRAHNEDVRACPATGSWLQP